MRENGRVETVNAARGPLLGAFPDPEYHEETFRLAPGELVLMYTDGVTDVGRADAPVRERGLLRLLGASAGRSADEVAEQVLTYALHSQGGEPTDDIAALSVRALNGR
ncbi:MAG TPA: PP2C family protein-serine/threonine phosphatase [Solirubrobacteraceae bacterium]|nr:PP2C family protein-serine/threonine phosphatase [Solirubrobacteraceae bacterium]